MQEAIRTCPKLRDLVLSYNLSCNEALLAQTFQTVSCNAVHSVEARCCNWILSTRDRIDTDVLPLTHADWAELLRVQRYTDSIVLPTFRTQDLIVQHRGGISIVQGLSFRQRPSKSSCHSILVSSETSLKSSTLE